MNAKRISIGIYALLGLIFLLGGGVALFHPSISLASDWSSLNTEPAATLSKDLLHTTMELGTAIVAIGSVLIWAAFNPERSTSLNYFFLFFFLLFGMIHWYEFFMGNRSITSPLINSIPAALIGIVMLIRKK